MDFRNTINSKLSSLRSVLVGVNTRPPKEKSLSTAAKDAIPALNLRNSVFILGKKSRTDNEDVGLDSRN